MQKQFARFLVIVSFLTVFLAACGSQQTGNVHDDTTSSEDMEDGSFVHPLNEYAVTVPNGWYPHPLDGGVVVFTKSEDFTMPQGTESYAIGPQIVTRTASLSEIADATSFEDWMRGNGMTQESEFLVERSTVTDDAGREWERVVMNAAGADGQTLSYIRPVGADRLFVLTHYPFTAGNDDSDAFEEFFGSISLPNDDAVTSGDGPGNESSTNAEDAARTALSAAIGADASTITIVGTTPREWSDSCLGLGRADESCAQMLTEGFIVVLEHSGKQYRYRTNMDGTVVRAEP